MNEPERQDLVISQALRTFLRRTCGTCKRQLYTFSPCEYCGDSSIILTICCEEIPLNWQECKLRVSINEFDTKTGKRSYSHKKSSRKDLDLVFRKKVGKDARTAYEILLYDRMKKLKKHTIQVLEGNEFTLTHNEIMPL